MNTKNRNLSGSIQFIASRIWIYLFLSTILFPVIFVVLTSLKPSTEFYTNIWGLPKTLALSNYRDALIKGGIGAAFINSMIIVSASVFFQLIFGALAGYSLARLRIPKAELIVMALVATCTLPAETLIIPEFFMASALKITGTHMGLILTYIGWGLAMTIFTFHGFFKTIPIELIESGRIDGAGELRTFYSIVMPLMKPAVVTCAIYNFVSYWGELLWAVVTLSNQSKLRTMPFAAIEFQGQYATDWGPFAAAICIIILPMTVFFLFTQKYFIAGLTAGAVKG